MTPSQESALQFVAKLLGAGAAAGVGARALMGAGNFLPSPKKAPPPLNVIDVPYRVKRPKPPIEESDEAAVLPPKMATGGFWDHAEHSWFLPAITAGLPLSAIAGWGLTNNVLQRRHQRDLEDEEEEEKQRLIAAEIGKFKPVETKKLASQYEAILAGKTPDDAQWKEAAAALDELAAACQEKSAAWWDTIPGAYFGYAAPAGLVSGAAAYNYFRSTDPKRLKAKAMKDQLEEAEADRPSDLMARLMPVDETGKPLSPAELNRLREQQNKTVSG